MKKIFNISLSLSQITTEIQILQDLQNEFISAYVDSFIDGEFYCIITEFYPVT